MTNLEILKQMLHLLDGLEGIQIDSLPEDEKTEESARIVVKLVQKILDGIRYKAMLEKEFEE